MTSERLIQTKDYNMCTPVCGRMQNSNGDYKCLKMLIANTIVNHIFLLLVDVTESCF